MMYISHITYYILYITDHSSNEHFIRLIVLCMLTSKAVVHESFPSTKIPSVDDPRSFAPTFDPGTGIFTV